MAAAILDANYDNWKPSKYSSCKISLQSVVVYEKILKWDWKVYWLQIFGEEKSINTQFVKNCLPPHDIITEYG